jgi:Protein of unknown function (DUF2442)
MTKSSVGWEPVRYCVDTDTMAVEVRPWPGRPGETAEGEDAGLDLVIHDYLGDGEPWLWEIEHASEHPEHIAAALREMRSRQSKPHTIKEVKFFGGGDARLFVSFDDDDRPEFHDMVDLSPIIAQGGIFERLQDPNIFQWAKIGPDRHTLIWRVGKGEDDVVALSADALWAMKIPWT